MKTLIHLQILITVAFCSVFLCTDSNAQVLKFTEYGGIVVDESNNNPLESVSIKLSGTNLGTITNGEGAFSIKVPDEYDIDSMSFSLLGYKSVTKKLSELSRSENKIKLSVQVTELSQVNISSFKNAEALVRAVFEKKAQNNLIKATVMTAFYRETIKRRNRNVSLTEAVVNLYKKPYISSERDAIGLRKARKSTDYRRLDTVALKLQGGPFSTLYIDIMKYPEYIFTSENMSEYDFSFDEPTTINNKPVYVVNFRQKADVEVPRYFGSLFIDSETLALSSAVYELNLVGMEKYIDNLFVKKKPRDVKVTPLKASYKVDYREKEGLWYYGYGSVELSFKVNKKGKLFNSNYTLASEMAVTDWELETEAEKLKPKDRMRPTIIMSDAVSGFSDPDFWGAYNVIEPEKSIESAINKIQRKLRRNNG